MSDESGPPGPREPRGGALAGVLADLSRLRARVEAVEAQNGLSERVEGLAGQVEAIVEAVQDLEGRQKAVKPPPIWWDLLDEAEIAEARPEFLAWLRDVLAVAYPEAVRELARCWEDHPAARQALTAAWRTWTAAYRNPAADSRDDADWQVRWRFDLVKLAVDATAECRENGHHEAPQELPLGLLTSFEPAVER